MASLNSQFPNVTIIGEEVSYCSFLNSSFPLFIWTTYGLNVDHFGQQAEETCG